MLLLLLALAAAPLQEPKSIPKDSVEVLARGCLKGRVFTAVAPPEDERARSGPDVTGRSFRVAGPKEISDAVKRYDRQLVEVVGIVRRTALDDQGAGLKVGRARVVIGAQGIDPTRGDTRTTGPTVPVMDVTALRHLSDRCPIGE